MEALAAPLLLLPLSLAKPSPLPRQSDGRSSAFPTPNSELARCPTCVIGQSTDGIRAAVVASVAQSGAAGMDVPPNRLAPMSMGRDDDAVVSAAE
jgi:hypothetical protein